MRFTRDQIRIAKRLTLGATVFQNYFLKDHIFREQFKDNYKALVCFLQNYAYERQGAARAYPLMARMTIKELFKGKIRSITRNDAKESWKKYKEIAKRDFNNIKLNESHNPMNFDEGVLTIMAHQRVSNLSVYVKRLIQRNETAEAHNFIASIRGVGSKIAPFYLRDITYLGGLDENKIKDQYYLQPIDTWLNQSLSIILGDEAPTRLRQQQKVIVQLCKAANCSAIAFNQGAWVLGSQVAGNFKTFKELARGKDAREIIRKHVSDKKRYLAEMEKIVDKFG